LKIQKQLDDTDENQTSTTDPDSRHMIVRNNITALYDKGYHTGSEFEITAKLGIGCSCSYSKSSS